MSGKKGENKGEKIGIKLNRTEGGRVMEAIRGGNKRKGKEKKRRGGGRRRKKERGGE